MVNFELEGWDGEQRLKVQDRNERRLLEQLLVELMEINALLDELNGKVVLEAAS